ncbi:MAG: glutamine-hydrolyzing GMP synthase [bacterium]
MKAPVERLVILDFGSPHTLLIARKIRELNVYCEVLPFDADPDRLLRKEVRGLILSGGTHNAHTVNTFLSRLDIFSLDRPILGIGAGCAPLIKGVGAAIDEFEQRECASADLEILDSAGLFQGIETGTTTPVWMCMSLNSVPAGFTVLGRTVGSSCAAFVDVSRRIYGVLFHPEVEQTEHGGSILANFALNICGCPPSWTADRFIEDAIMSVQNHVKTGQVLCALSGGVDSAVVAMLLDRAIGDQLVAVFIDNGVLRAGEADAVKAYFSSVLGDRFVAVDASAEFLSSLRGVTDPEQKRRIIGHTFIHIFEREAHRLGKIDFLAQGTLYPDIIESVSARDGSVAVKSHHNVGGLPEAMRLELVEPLRELFKDEVRVVAAALGMPEALIRRQPFPGPGLAVRILGEVTPERVAVLQKADAIVREETAAAGLMPVLWQAFAVLLPLKTVGMKGHQRTYEDVCAIRVVESTDAMTARWAHLPYDLLDRLANRIIGEVKGINRVVYDISSKPPATIEWE